MKIHRKRLGERALLPLALALALLASGCSNATTSSEEIPKQASVGVALAPTLAARVATVSTGLGQVQVEPGKMPEVNLAVGSSGLVSAADEQGNVLGVGVGFSLDGVDPLPVRVDYQSTAFAQMLLTPGMATSTPAVVVLLRGLAQKSPAFIKLAESLETRAQSDPDYLANPSSAEARLLMSAIADVTSALAELGRQARISAAGNAGGGGGFTKSAPAHSVLSKSAGPLDCNNGLLELGEAGAAGLCASLVSPRDADVAKLEVQNFGMTWAWVDTQLTAPAPIIPPTQFSLPGVKDILTQAYKLAQVVGGTFVGVVVEGIDRLFFNNERFDETQFFDSLYGDISINVISTGFSRINVAHDELFQGLHALNSRRASSLDPTQDYVAPVNATGQLLALTAVTQMVLPALELVSGTKADRRRLKDLYDSMPPDLIAQGVTASSRLMTKLTPEEMYRVVTDLVTWALQQDRVVQWLHWGVLKLARKSEFVDYVDSLVDRLAKPVEVAQKASGALVYIASVMAVVKDLRELEPTTSWVLPTEITFTARDCEGCRIWTYYSENLGTLEKPLPAYEEYPLAVIRNGMAKVTVPTFQTAAMYFALTTPDDRTVSDARAIIVIQYLGVPAGTEVSAQDTLRHKKAYACWAGTPDPSVTLNLEVRRWEEDPIDLLTNGKGISVWLSPQWTGRGFDGLGGKPQPADLYKGAAGANGDQICARQ